MGNAIRINPFVFLTANAIMSNADARAAATHLFTEMPMQDGIDWIYPALSHVPGDGLMGDKQTVDTFEVARFDAMVNEKAKTNDCIFVDENGLYNNVNDVWLIVRGAWQPFAGAGLVTGTTPNGNTVAPKSVDIPWLKSNTLIIVQNLIYHPGIEKIAATVGRGVAFADRMKFLDRNHPVWNPSHATTKSMFG